MHTRKNYQILKKYFISFALVFLLPSMFIVLFFNTYTTNLIGKQSQDRQMNQFANYCEDIENRLQNLKNIFVELSVDKETLVLENASNTDLDDVTRLKLYSKKLYVFSFINNMIKGINVYYNDGDCVINSKGKFSYYYSYDQFFKTFDIPQDDLKKMLCYNNALKIFSTGGSIIAVQSFPIGEYSPQGSIIINIDESILMGFAADNGTNTSGSFVITDKDGNVIAGSSKNIISRNIIQQSINQNEKVKRGVWVDGKEYMAMCAKASIEGLYYLSFMPVKELEGNINDFNKLMLKVILIFFILGLSVVWAFSIINYTPVKAMLKQISSGDKKELAVKKIDGGKANEYDIIKMYIDDLCREKDDLGLRVNIHMNDTRNNFLKELVTDGCSIERFNEMIDLLNLNLQYENFCFVYIVMDDVGQLDANEINKKFMVWEKMDEIIMHFASGYRLQIDNNKKGIVLNINSDVGQEQVIECFRQLCTELKENNGASVKIGIGEIYKGCNQLFKSYKEAFEAARYCCFYEVDICTFSEIDKSTKDSYYYPSSMENKLINCCEIGELESVAAIISEIISKNFVEEKLSMESAYALYYNLKGTLNRVITKFNIDISEVYGKKSEKEIDPNEFNNLEQISMQMKCLYRAVCEYSRRIKTNQAENIVKDVIRYINDNYCDKYLSCMSVADKFNISQPYLSVILKKSTGMNYGDYVNNLRMKEAKKLLRENELSINEIAVKLGYGSGNGLMRTFKNIEGVTPRQYSNSISDKENL